MSMTGFRNLFLQGLQILFTTEYCLTRESHYVVILLEGSIGYRKVPCPAQSFDVVVKGYFDEGISRE